MIRISAWTAFFLVLLRLAIGWHFAYEGYHKIHSTYTDKPFTADAYFREAEGPLGNVMRRVVGDADATALALLTPKPAEAAGKPRDRLPDALGQQYDDYLKRFEAYYPLTDARKQEAAGKLDQAKDQTVAWLLGNKEAGGEKEVERKSPAGNATVKIKMTTPERVAEYRKKLAEVRDVYDQKLPDFGKDVEKQNLRTLKGDVASLRTDLLDDLNKQVTAMKDALASIVRLPPDGSFPLPLPENVAPEQYLAELLTPGGDADPAKAENLPSELAKQWDAWFDRLTKAYPLNPDQTERAKQLFADAKERTARWVQDQKPLPGTVPPEVNVPEKLRAYRAKLAQVQDAVKADPKGPATYGYRAELVVMMPYLYTDLDRQTADMKKSVETVLTADQAKGYAPEPDKPKVLGVVPSPFSIEGMDWMTRWGLTILGVCLLLGLFTRLSCLGAAAFLLMTYLLVPPFPWLPQPPLNEGNYFFVNKNVIEMLALLALATTASGKWFGVDALISWAFGRRRKPADGNGSAPAPVDRRTAKAPARTGTAQTTHRL
jgi:uncharacterized membrane protein YphA (DoxX/SURF4 family)